MTDKNSQDLDHVYHQVLPKVYNELNQTKQRERELREQLRQAADDRKKAADERDEQSRKVYRLEAELANLKSELRFKDQNYNSYYRKVAEGRKKTIDKAGEALSNAGFPVEDGDEIHKRIEDLSDSRTQLKKCLEAVDENLSRSPHVRSSRNSSTLDSLLCLMYDYKSEIANCEKFKRQLDKENQKIIQPVRYFISNASTVPMVRWIDHNGDQWVAMGSNWKYQLDNTVPYEDFIVYGEISEEEAYSKLGLDHPMSELEINPCPLCGNRATFVRKQNCLGYVKCFNSCCGARTIEMHFNHKNSVIKQWNIGLCTFDCP